MQQNMNLIIAGSNNAARKEFENPQMHNDDVDPYIIVVLCQL